MKNLVIVLVSFFVTMVSAQETKHVFGKVSDGKNPIPYVNVTLVGEENTTITDKDGFYKIYAKEGDKLQFIHAGLKSVTVQIEDVTRVLNLIMTPVVTELDEVVMVESKKCRSQKELREAYATDKKILKTAFGYVDGERSPNLIRYLNEAQLKTSLNYCVLDLLRANFPGVKVSGNCFRGGSVFIRQSREAAIFDVDGQAFNEVPLWLIGQNIQRLAIMYPPAGFGKYGSRPSGGVVVVNTVSGSLPYVVKSDKEKLKQAFSQDSVLTSEEVAENAPDYLKKFASSKSFQDAKLTFENLKKRYQYSPYFYLDSYNYFTATWKKESYAEKLIEDNFRLFQDNAVLLKALAYHYEEHGRFQRAHDIYKAIFILRPQYAQSYFDVANSYRNIGDFKSAATIYARYKYLLNEGILNLDAVSKENIVNREFENLLILEGKSILKENPTQASQIKTLDFEGNRLVFEWNDSEAEFDLHIFNPGNHYFIWNHSWNDNPETIQKEKEYGYNVTEYFLDNYSDDNWSVNINYFGNKSLTPTYLKTTFYRDYGSKSQKKVVKVFRLYLKDKQQRLFTLSKGDLAFLD